jgi:hypothetical protein
MTNLAVAIVRIWVRLYTMGFEATVRERIRQEIEADLWEQMNSGSTSGSPMKNAMTIFLRLILGMPADVQRMIEEPSFGGFSVNTMKVWGVVTRRQFWINFLVVSGVFLSFIILVIAPLVVAIINRL